MGERVIEVKTEIMLINYLSHFHGIFQIHRRLLDAALGNNWRKFFRVYVPSQIAGLRFACKGVSFDDFSHVTRRLQTKVFALQFAEQT